jgi:hypothetical protein
MLGCYQSLDLCAIRASLLEADGSRTGALVNGSAYNMRPITLSSSANITTGDTIEQRDGCGNICASITDPDVLTGYSLVLTLCQFDYELLSILTGGDLLLEGDMDVIGFEAPLTSTTSIPVEFNAWSKNYSGSSQVGAPYAYKHHIWPKVQWTLGDLNLERGVLNVTVNGTASENANLGGGSFNDLPGAGVQAAYAVFDASDIPDPDSSPYNGNGLSCGFVDTPASAS